MEISVQILISTLLLAQGVLSQLENYFPFQIPFGGEIKPRRVDQATDRFFIDSIFPFNLLSETPTTPSPLVSPVNGQTGFSISPQYGANMLGSSQLLGQPQCPLIPQCRPSKYRSIDGSCNNLRNPQWGAANTPYGRIHRARYGDGVHSPRLSSTQNALPDARLLSRIFSPEIKINEQDYTLALMQWGQIVTHDMSMAVGTGSNTPEPMCCTRGGLPAFDRISKNEPCYPITLAEDDPLALKYNQRCMDFIRTTTDQFQGCPSSNEAQQLSGVSHWLDGSLVYGFNDRLAQQLRTRQGGQLIVEVRNQRAYPPTNLNATFLDCARPPSQQACYLAGDARVNQNPQLTLLQIVLLREHNRVANAFEAINPHWSDETIYQEARRFVIAEIQHITYSEYLPALLGKDQLLQSGIIYRSKGAFVNDYDEQIDPSVLNEHAHGAFRYFHTNIQGLLKLMSEHRHSQGSIVISQHLQDPSVLEDPRAFDGLTRGLVTQHQEATDRFLTREMTENLFRTPGSPFSGQDLRAVDIQRARDHGLGTYNDYRHFCGMNKAQRFEDFADHIGIELVQALSKIYEYPDDVDLIIGGTLERHVHGALAGPTFLCILKEQFFRTRVADRYFYERGDYEGAFTPIQLYEVRKTSLARLLCDNSDNLYTIQAKAFLAVNKDNPLVPCAQFTSIPISSLDAWRENNYEGVNIF